MSGLGRRSADLGLTIVQRHSGETIVDADDSLLVDRYHFAPLLATPSTVRSRITAISLRIGRSGTFRGIPQPACGLLLIASGLCALTTLVFRQQLFDHWTLPWDFLGGYTTTPAFVAASVRDGHLLSWSPFVASGFPVDVDTQAGVYFPGWWLLGVLHISATLRVLTAVQVAHVLFGSLGTLALGRARGLKWTWAALAAVAYLFFGGFYGEAEHADIFRGFAYLPWLLWSLTPPGEKERWTRLAALPLLAWLIVSGAYPGQLVSFGLSGLLYASVALWGAGRAVWQRHRRALVFAVVAAVSVCVAALLPYLRAEQAHELYRAFEPTSAVRAGESISPLDLLGLYLNNFAWTPDGTVTAWAVGIPMLVGLACVRWEALRRQAPLVVCGTVALVLAMAPKIGVIGRAMTSVHLLFPSRFPAAEYKSVVAVALVVLGAESWSQLASRREPWRAVLVGCVLVAGALLAPSTYAQPTRVLWLLAAVVVASSALALVRLHPRVLAALLIGLVIIDGVREAYDYRLLGHISPWRVSSTEAAAYLGRDGDVRELPARLKQAPTSRPARVPPAAPLSQYPTGTNSDSSGWVADGYHLIDYGGTIERVLWQAEHNPAWLSLLLEPWHGYTFPCATVGCGNGAVHLPASSVWRPSPAVRTLSYGTESIVYAVNTAEPVLMVENELAIRGWHSNTQLVHSINAGIPLRAWRLAPGRYTFVASFQEPGRELQLSAAVVALIAWLGCALLVSRRSIGARPKEPPSRT